MQPLLLHTGFTIVGLMLAFGVKNLNPAELDYELEVATTIDCVDSDLSGITYHRHNKTFFVVTNYPEKLVEISATGECLNSQALDAFEDTEDVFYVSEDNFLIVEERKRALNYVHINQGKVSNSQTLVLNIGEDSNKGLEGVTYSQELNSIYLVIEDPEQIIKISNWNLQRSFDRIETIDSFWAQALMADYSAITDASDGLLLLSHESNRLLKLDYKGSVLGSLDLISNYDPALKQAQPEGVAVDDEDNIYIVSEPNYLHVYKKKPATSAGFFAFALSD